MEAPASQISAEPYAAALRARMREAGTLLTPGHWRREEAAGQEDDDRPGDEAGRVAWVLEGGRTVSDPEPVFVCRKENRSYLELALGESCVAHQAFAAALPDTETIQAVLEPWGFVTGRSQKLWIFYTKDEVFMYRVDSNDKLVIPVGLFPPPPQWQVPRGTHQWGGARCDVWTAPVDLSVRVALDEHAALTDDRPIPRYQMIVDPNQFVRETVRGSVWVPCEFDVLSDGSARLVGGERSHLHPHLAEAVATPVLTAALPLLAKLRRPRLLLAGRRLQVVVKAQKILVPPHTSDGADSEYVGLWHVDGDREHVAAVVLYYYHVDPDLQGGAMEFCGREPFDCLGRGDCSQNYRELDAASLHRALRGGGACHGEQPARVPNCRVPIGSGTLLVFSNYQMVHRVLRMVNRHREREASRDFVALFVIDPAATPLVPARSHLASQYLRSRTLGGIRVSSRPLKQACVQLALEFEGTVASRVERLRRRRALLREQLRPRGQFGDLGGVFATGNGCYTMIGWLDRLLGEEEASEGWLPEENRQGWDRFEALNLAPRHMDRGMSEVLSMQSAELAERLQAWRNEGAEIESQLAET